MVDDRASVDLSHPPDRWAGRRWDGHLDFYNEIYPYAVSESRRTGQLGLSLLEVLQESGDWSDASGPDLVLTRVKTNTLRASVNFGGGRGTHTLSSRDLLLVPPEFATTVVAEDPHALDIVAIPYRRLTALAGPAAGLLGDGDFGRLHRGAWRSAVTQSIVDGLWAATNGDYFGSDLAADALALQLAEELLRLRNGGASRLPSALPPRKVALVKARLAERGAPSLAELAAEADLSPGHLLRSFRAAEGTTPQAWARSHHLSAAADRLSSTSEPIAEIAAEAGYASQQGFTTAFGRAYGITPARYRWERRG